MHKALFYFVPLTIFDTCAMSFIHEQIDTQAIFDMIIHYSVHLFFCYKVPLTVFICEFAAMMYFIVRRFRNRLTGSWRTTTNLTTTVLSSHKGRLLSQREVRAGRPVLRQQRHLHDVGRALLGRERPGVDGHVGAHVAGVRAVDAQPRVAPR